MSFRQALARGTLVAGDYRIETVLGQGGFGLTYEAFDLGLARRIAIKEYFPSDLAVREAGNTVRAKSSAVDDVYAWGRQKFIEEARTLARFNHPGIVRVLRVFEANNSAYMVLDFEDGPNLKTWSATLGRRPSQAELDHIATRLLDALELVHGSNVLHRDIAPDNVLMRGNRDPVLIDFGSARAVVGARTQTVHAVVKPGYSPKEQYALGVDAQGPWTDIYALGATLYMLIAGRSPPDALTRDLGDAMQKAETMSTDGYRHGFLTAIDAALALDRGARPQSVRDWREALLADEGGAAAESHRARSSLHTEGHGSRLSTAAAEPASPLPSARPPMAVNALPAKATTALVQGPWRLFQWWLSRGGWWGGARRSEAQTARSLPRRLRRSPRGRPVPSCRSSRRNQWRRLVKVSKFRSAWRNAAA